MKYLITSALPYVNGTKHLGNLVGSLLPADVYARYLRAKGEDVLYICATDEHGSPTEIAAKQEGITPEALCERQYKIQLEMNKNYNLKFDYFGRSSSENNTKLVQHIAEELEKNGFIEEKVIKQFYSIDDDMFLADRFIIGTCPHCGNTSARGDQCEICTQVLDPVDLINPRSAISGSSNLELRETKHLFLAQSKLAGELEAWINKQFEWPKLVKSIALKWLKEGLQDRCITRDLSWGVPVNKPGYENKVFYVWFDAPIAYISATKDWADEDPEHRNFMDWWGAKADVRYTQFMGKDNIPFHTISFPATIIGAGNEFKQPDYIKGVNWLNYYGGKFSTSAHRGVFMNQAIELFDADYWRYALMSMIPEKDDSNFTWEDFAKAVNGDLADSYGNLVQRVCVMLKKNFEGVLPEVGAFGAIEEKLIADLTEAVCDYDKNMKELEFRKATQSLHNVFMLANAYIAEKEPWKKVKEGGDRADAALTLKTAVNIILMCAVLSSPFIPATSEKVLSSFGVKENERAWPVDVRAALDVLGAGRAIEAPGILFAKIMPERIEELKAQFGDETNAVKQKGKELHI
ncbi:MAG: methionine--tRNA ligase [Alphaproteobacteria bacterium]|nr:methionine--tRNA ligase [Alphaproteobacteria bacterium]